MQNLEKRLSALEMANPHTCAADQMTFVIRFISPGKPYGEIHSLRAREEVWTRLPGETEKDLIARASAEVTRTPHGSALIIEVKP